MWPGGPRPPLAPIPVPPHLQAQHQAQQQAQHQAQQQALFAQQQQQALVAHQQPAGQWAAPGFYNPMTGLPSWDLTDLTAALSTTSLTPPSTNEWYFDSGATNVFRSSD